ITKLNEVNSLTPHLISTQRAMRWSGGDVGMFVEAEEEILGLLASDPFARFKQSELFQEFLSSAQAYIEVKAGKTSSTLTGPLPPAAASASGRAHEAEQDRMRRMGEEIRAGKQ